MLALRDERNEREKISLTYAVRVELVALKPFLKRLPLRWLIFFLKAKLPKERFCFTVSNMI